MKLGDTPDGMSLLIVRTSGGVVTKKIVVQQKAVDTARRRAGYPIIDGNGPVGSHQTGWLGASGRVNYSGEALRIHFVPGQSTGVGAWRACHFPKIDVLHKFYGLIFFL